jgi:hypothetical protein
MSDSHLFIRPPHARAAAAMMFFAAVALSRPAAGAEMAEGPAAADSAAAAAAPTYLRVVAEEERFVALEAAAVDFAAPQEGWPTVGLVGVVHIADRGYYQAVQDLLKAYDIVLYESVKPAGAAGAGAETDDQRIDSTRAALEFVGGVIAEFHARHDRYPADLAELRAFAGTVDPRLPAFLQAALTDGWGHPILYERKVDDGLPSPKDGDREAMPDTPPYLLTSLGADGKSGGDGADADLILDDPASIDPPLSDEGAGLQAQLADALGLAFQLEALDYGGANWRCSDMSIDQLQREMAARGLDFSLIEDSLAGSSLPAQIIRVLLGLMRFADAFLDGAVSDTVKVFLIELLGDESTIGIGFDQLGEGFTEVLVDRRNEVVIDDLKRLIEAGEPAKSVAILYGAGHLPDLAERLVGQLGYEPGKTRWLRAIEVDLTASAVSERDVKQLRFLVRRTLRQMSRMNEPVTADED